MGEVVRRWGEWERRWGEDCEVREVHVRRRRGRRTGGRKEGLKGGNEVH